MDHVDFQQQQHRVTLNGIARVPVDVAYVDRHPESKNAVLLLHGIPTWSYLYRDVIQLLESSLRVIAPDFLGHGWSERRDITDRSLETQAQMVIALLDHLELTSVHVVGHDTGGGVGMILALDHPQRLRTLTLTNSVAYDSWPIDDMIALGDPQWSTKPAANVASFVRAGLKDGISRPERLTDSWAEGILAPYSDSEGALSLIRNAAALNTNHTSALTGLLDQIRTPTLILWGVDDPWQTYEDAKRLHRDIPGSTLKPIKDASHWIPQDAPDDFASSILDFILNHS